MPVGTIASSTGPAVLPDVGELSYNDITFSSLYTSHIEGRQVLDSAGRVVKYLEYVITADAIITLSAVRSTIDPTLATLRDLLSEAGGPLTYSGKGFGPLVVNTPGGLQDVNYGPKPRLLEFIPLGGSLAAKVKWEVVTYVPETANQLNLDFSASLVQFCYGNTIKYDEDGYSQISVKGVYEVPGRRRSLDNRDVTDCADNVRRQVMVWVGRTFELEYFRIVSRHFEISEDKRTMTFEVVADELPPDPLPFFCQTARGSFTVRPVEMGPAMCRWMCNLRCTYTVQKNQPRRTAYIAFLNLWQFRMKCSEKGILPGLDDKAAADAVKKPTGGFLSGLGIGVTTGWVGAEIARKLASKDAVAKNLLTAGRRAIPVNFEVDEGLYLDSKTISFQASWLLFCNWQSLLYACGIWRGDGTKADDARLQWKNAAVPVSGYKSWLINKVDITQDVIVDLGGSGGLL